EHERATARRRGQQTARLPVRRATGRSPVAPPAATIGTIIARVADTPTLVPRLLHGTRKRPRAGPGAQYKKSQRFVSPVLTRNRAQRLQSEGEIGLRRSREARRHRM